MECIVKYSIKLTKRSLRNLDEVASYYEKLERGLGIKFAQYFFKQINVLCSLPNLGKFGKVDGTRELLFQEFPYLVVYRIIDNCVQIISLIHQYNYSIVKEASGFSLKANHLKVN